jgi:hypothetical protein
MNQPTRPWVGRSPYNIKPAVRNRTCLSIPFLKAAPRLENTTRPYSTSPTPHSMDQRGPACMAMGDSVGYHSVRRK